AFDGPATRRPKMWGVQAEGAAPFVKGQPIKDPETVATAIRIGNPASWDLAVTARDESGGWIRAVLDDEILAAQALLAGEVGVRGWCRSVTRACVVSVGGRSVGGVASGGGTQECGHHLHGDR